MHNPPHSAHPHQRPGPPKFLGRTGFPEKGGEGVVGQVKRIKRPRNPEQGRSVPSFPSPRIPRRDAQPRDTDPGLYPPPWSLPGSTPWPVPHPPSRSDQEAGVPERRNRRRPRSFPHPWDGYIQKRTGALCTKVKGLPQGVRPSNAIRKSPRSSQSLHPPRHTTSGRPIHPVIDPPFSPGPGAGDGVRRHERA